MQRFKQVKSNPSPLEGLLRWMSVVAMAGSHCKQSLAQCVKNRKPDTAKAADINENP